MNRIWWKQSVRLIVIAMIGVVVFGRQAAAHHSFPATYVKGEEVTIEGELVAFQFRNPHSYIQMSVKDETGNVIQYAIEWRDAGSLQKEGIDRFTLKPGDFVIITGLPARNKADHKVLLRTIERPSDGFKWVSKGEP